MDKFEILIASLPHREHLVAEIYCNNMYWAQLSKEKKEIVVQFYSHPNDKCWEFSYEEALEALQQAKTMLLS